MESTRSRPAPEELAFGRGRLEYQQPLRASISPAESHRAVTIAHRAWHIFRDSQAQLGIDCLACWAAKSPWLTGHIMFGVNLLLQPYFRRITHLHSWGSLASGLLSSDNNAFS